MDFYNNKDNDILKFKLNTEGVDKDKIETRLILTSKEKSDHLPLINMLIK